VQPTPASDPGADRPGLRVEELARAAGLSVDTVRYYQGRGLLQPPVRDGRVARYGPAHLDRLREIRRLVDAGLTLAQIGSLLDDRAGPALRALAALGSTPTLGREELAARAEVPVVAVDLAVDAGLLQPVLVGDEPRFDEGAAGMLAAAAGILRAGVPLPALLSLAADHAEHTERLVDRAVELFRVRGVTTDRSSAVRELVPRVTELVAEHFRQTLLSRVLVQMVDPEDQRALATAAVERARATRRPQLVALARRLPLPVDPLALSRTSLWSDAATRAAVLHPDDRVALVGVGAAHVIAHPGGEGRFAAVAAAARRLAATIHRDRSVPDWAGPLLLGGFAYLADGGRSGDWRPFGPARFVLPEVLVASDGAETWVVRSATVEAGDDPEAVLRGLDAAVAEVLAAVGDADPDPAAGASRPGVDQPPADPPREADPAYVALVTRALADIAAGRLEKVVLARSVLVPGAGPSAPDLLTRLRDERPGCASFWFEADGAAFVGSTPELLVGLDGDRVTSAAVAGTSRRDPAAGSRADAAAAAAFLADPKEQAEHRFVLDALRDRLVGAGVALDASPVTGVLDLPGLRHLFTPVSGTLTRVPGSVAELAGALHPTPAVGGSPLVASERWLRDHEGLDRGWYAAPVGVLRLDGGGSLWVGLRSALVTGAGTRLYAGAGVVLGSDPDRELAETSLKLQTMGAALLAASRSPHDAAVPS
jgi:isochorismate synthase